MSVFGRETLDSPDLVERLVAPLRRLLYGARVFECGCREQFETEMAYEQHWTQQHGREPSNALREVAPGIWAPAIPLPWYVRKHRRADW